MRFAPYKQAVQPCELSCGKNAALAGAFQQIPGILVFQLEQLLLKGELSVLQTAQQITDIRIRRLKVLAVFGRDCIALLYQTAQGIGVQTDIKDDKAAKTEQAAEDIDDKNTVYLIDEIFNDDIGNRADYLMSIFAGCRDDRVFLVVDDIFVVFFAVGI